jgi:hypothetical protein
MARTMHQHSPKPRFGSDFAQSWRERAERDQKRGISNLLPFHQPNR